MLWFIYVKNLSTILQTITKPIVATPLLKGGWAVCSLSSQLTTHGFIPDLPTHQVPLATWGPEFFYLLSLFT